MFKGGTFDWTEFIFRKMGSVPFKPYVRFGLISFKSIAHFLHFFSATLGIHFYVTLQETKTTLNI